MIRRIVNLADPFLLLLIGVVLLATFLPARGDWYGIAHIVTNAGIVLLFFLHGAKLSREAILAGATNWRLHVAVLATSFLIFPLIGLGFAQAPATIIAPAAAAGIIYLSVLPSTVQSSIAFTSIAGGNVPAAVCSASFSNLLGTVVTPLWVALLLTGRAEMGAGSTLQAVEQIVVQLLLPFLLGHLSRPLTAGFIQRHAKIVSKVDRGSIMLVVYTAFSAAVNEGLWHTVSGITLAQILIACALILALVLAITWGLGKAMGFNRPDAIVLLFCGSKKSLASGVPMAAVLFPAAQVGMIILPLMIFHQIQLMVCAILARGFARGLEKRAP